MYFEFILMFFLRSCFWRGQVDRSRTKLAKQAELHTQQQSLLAALATDADNDQLLTQLRYVDAQIVTRALVYYSIATPRLVPRARKSQKISQRTGIYHIHVHILCQGRSGLIRDRPKRQCFTSCFSTFLNCRSDLAWVGPGARDAGAR